VVPIIKQTRKQKKCIQQALQTITRREIDIIPDHMMLEMLLLYVIEPPQNNKVSHLLLDKFITLYGTINAPLYSLCEVEGVNFDTAVFIKIIFKAIRSYLDSAYSQSMLITDACTAKNYMSSKFVGLSIETVYLAGLGYNGRVIFCKKMAEGTPHDVNIMLIDIIREAISASAVKVILAHNHPYGICVPTRNDIHTTRLLDSELKRFRVELFDHIIVADDDIYSMREQDMIANYTLSYGHR